MIEYEHIVVTFEMDDEDTEVDGLNALAVAAAGVEFVDVSESLEYDLDESNDMPTWAPPPEVG